MEHSMHAPAEQDRSVSKPPAEPVDPHAGHDMSEPMEPERTDMDHAGMEHGTPAAQQAEPMDHAAMGHGMAQDRDLPATAPPREPIRSEEHTSELQSIMRISSAVFCLKKKKKQPEYTNT